MSVRIYAIPVFILLHSISFHALSQSGSVGINTTTPTAPLHVVRFVPSSGPKSNHVMAILESNEESFIQLSNPENASTGIYSGDRWTPIRSALLFGGDSSLIFQAGGAQTRMLITKNGKIGMNTISPLAMLHVQDSSVLFTGPADISNNSAPPPVSGQGTRMMWYADKAAFRAGGVANAQWDKENTGAYSFSAGQNTVAKGNYSFSFGFNTKANGVVSGAFGGYSRADGDFSTAFGNGIAKSYCSFVVGGYNDTSSISSVTWIPSDPLFVLGNGTSIQRKNAFTVLKNGKTGINTHNPASIFHVVRNNPSGGPLVSTALATFESDDDSYMYFSHPTDAQTGILSGNQATTIRSGLLFGVDSSLVFRSGGNYTKMLLDKSGRLGINTTSPQALLHIRRSGSSGGMFHNSSFAIMESTTPSYLQMSQKNNAETGILSGNESTIIRSALIFRADSSIAIRTGGNVDRVKITNDGAVGINIPDPLGLLHVRRGTSSPGVIHGEAIAIFQSETPAYIQLTVPSNTKAGIIASNDVSNTRAGVIFEGDNSLKLLAGGSNTRLTITPSGNTGIATQDPVAKLDVSGNFKLGVNGTVLNKILKLSFSANLPAIPAYGSHVETFISAGITIGGTAILSVGSLLPDGIIIACTHTHNGEVKIKFTNITSSSIDPVANTFHITVVQ